MSTNEVINYSISTLDSDIVQTYLNEIDPNYFDKYQVYSEPFCKKSFNKSFNTNFLVKPQFDSCSFDRTNFYGTTTTHSIMNNCEIHNCDFANSSFTLSSFSKCNFLNSKISNSSFENTVFENTSLNKSVISGCSFTNSIIENTVFENTSINYCDFSGTLFKHSKIINSDLTNNGFDYVEFSENVVVKNVIFPFMDIFHTFGGLRLLRSFKDEISLSLSDSSKIISGADCLEQLKIFIPYFYAKSDFLAVANISIFIGEQENAYNAIIKGLKNCLGKKDFKLLFNLCKLASYNCFFSQRELHNFYDLLQSEFIIEHLSTIEYRYYLSEMAEIKNMLIDKPFKMPQAVIKIYTNIQPDDYNSLSILLQQIDQIINTKLPQSIKHISLRHNSPDVLELFVSESLPNLLLFIGCFSSIVMGTTQIIKSIQNTVKNHKEIIGIELDNLIKKQELEKLKLENLERSTSQGNISNKNDRVEKITYYINTDINLSPELRQKSYKKNEN